LEQRRNCVAPTLYTPTGIYIYFKILKGGGRGGIVDLLPYINYKKEIKLKNIKKYLKIFKNNFLVDPLPLLICRIYTL
jgi:hypothetical protein